MEQWWINLNLNKVIKDSDTSLILPWRTYALG